MIKHDSTCTCVACMNSKSDSSVETVKVWRSSYGQNCLCLSKITASCGDHQGCQEYSADLTPVKVEKSKEYNAFVCERFYNRLGCMVNKCPQEIQERFNCRKVLVKEV